MAAPFWTTGPPTRGMLILFRADFGELALEVAFCESGLIEVFRQILESHFYNFPVKHRVLYAIQGTIHLACQPLDDAIDGRRHSAA